VYPQFSVPSGLTVDAIKMRLAEFIRTHTQPIIKEWEAFAQTLAPAADDMSPHFLRNHIAYILDFIASDIETPQTESEQVSKSHGGKFKGPNHTAAETHAALREAGGFNMDQMVSEYRALRERN
jgi:hypothetical protein